VRPETRFARSGRLSIAYQVVGDGLVYVPGFVSHVELRWTVALFAASLQRLWAVGQV